MNPLFSVIIPTYKRKMRLRNCLEAISKTTYPKAQFEVIVVDDSDDQGIMPFLLPFHERVQLLVLSQTNAGPAAARNKGRRHAKGKYLVFTDDDCVPASDWLEAMSQRLLKTPDGIIAGKTINAITDNAYSTASQLVIDYLFAHYNSDPDNAQFAISSNLAVPVEGFDAIGGFDISFTRPAGEDRDLCARWRAHGFRMVFAPEVVVRHLHTLSFRLFLRQHFNYGRAAYKFHKKSVAYKFNRGRLAPYKFYINLIIYPFSQPKLRNRWPLVILLALSQLATGAGYLMEKVS